MPLQRRLPKRGFNNTAFQKTWAIVNVSQLAGIPAGTVVDVDFMRALGLVKGQVDGVKVLGDGDVTAPLTVHADRFSAQARAKISGAGGQAITPEVAAAVG